MTDNAHTLTEAAKLLWPGSVANDQDVLRQALEPEDEAPPLILSVTLSSDELLLLNNYDSEYSAVNQNTAPCPGLFGIRFKFITPMSTILSGVDKSMLELWRHSTLSYRLNSDQHRHIVMMQGGNEYCIPKGKQIVTRSPTELFVTEENIELYKWQRGRTFANKGSNTPQQMPDDLAADNKEIGEMEMIKAKDGKPISNSQHVFTIGQLAALLESTEDEAFALSIVAMTEVRGTELVVIRKENTITTSANLTYYVKVQHIQTTVKNTDDDDWYKTEKMIVLDGEITGLCDVGAFRGLFWDKANQANVEMLWQGAQYYTPVNPFKIDKAEVVFTYENIKHYLEQENSPRKLALLETEIKQREADPLRDESKLSGVFTDNTIGNAYNIQERQTAIQAATQEQEQYAAKKLEEWQMRQPQAEQENKRTKPVMQATKRHKITADERKAKSKSAIQLAVEAYLDTALNGNKTGFYTFLKNRIKLTKEEIFKDQQSYAFYFKDVKEKGSQEGIYLNHPKEGKKEGDAGWNHYSKGDVSSIISREKNHREKNKL